MEFQVDYSASDSVFVPQPGPQTAAILCPADLVEAENSEFGASIGDKKGR
jgi:hypothetical protein